MIFTVVAPQVFTPLQLSTVRLFVRQTSIAVSRLLPHAIATSPAATLAFVCVKSVMIWFGVSEITLFSFAS